MFFAIDAITCYFSHAIYAMMISRHRLLMPPFTLMPLLRFATLYDTPRRRHGAISRYFDFAFFASFCFDADFLLHCCCHYCFLSLPFSVDMLADATLMLLLMMPRLSPFIFMLRCRFRMLPLFAFLFDITPLFSLRFRHAYFAPCHEMPHLRHCRLSSPPPELSMLRAITLPP